MIGYSRLPQARHTLLEALTFPMGFIPFAPLHRHGLQSLFCPSAQVLPGYQTYLCFVWTNKHGTVNNSNRDQVLSLLHASAQAIRFRPLLASTDTLFLTFLWGLAFFRLGLGNLPVSMYFNPRLKDSFKNDHRNPNDAPLRFLLAIFTSF